VERDGASNSSSSHANDRRVDRRIVRVVVAIYFWFMDEIVTGWVGQKRYYGKALKG
jgi:hypothetical protein